MDARHKGGHDTERVVASLRPAEGRTPPSWTLAQRLIAAGAAGVVVPSFAASATEGMRNGVLRRWGGEQKQVVPWDEGGRLR